MPRTLGRRLRLLALSIVLVPGVGACGQPSGEGGSGCADAGAPAPAVESWPTYSNDRFDYSFRYPEGFVVLEEPRPGTPSELPAGVVHRVRLRAPESAAADTADLQPPRFSVEVLQNLSQLPLERWLEETAAGRGGTRTAVDVGSTTGYKVQLDRYIAPGEFYYVSGGNHVYRLTPLGEHGDAVLGSFTVTG